MTTLPQQDGDGVNEPRASLDRHSHEADEWSSGRYRPMEEIGVGAYGIVYKARDTSPDADHGVVAMKCLRVENTEQGMPLSTVREIALLKQLETLEHENVVRMLDICTGRQTVRETQLMLVFEYIDQDLDMFLKNSPEEGIPATKIKDIMYQMLNGIDFLHSMRVIHRDLKPQNVLITNSGKIKIADFGLARIYSFDMALTAVVVTLWYRAPEVLLQDSYATPVDLWSVGCIFAELYNKRPLFRGSGDVNQIRKIFEFIGRPSEAEWPLDVAMPFTSFPEQRPCSPSLYVPRMDADAVTLLMKLLVFDPKRRLTAYDSFSEDYFKDLPAQSHDRPSTSHRSHVPDTSSSRRMQYARQITDPHASGDSRTHAEHSLDTAYGAETSHEGYDCPDSGPQVTRHSTITPGLEQVTTHDTADVTSRPRAFGNPLPLDSKDGASGSSSMVPPSAEESAFLTPPSDLASSSSGFMTSSSSRSSSTSSDVVSAPAPSTSTGFAVEASLRPPTSLPASIDSQNTDEVQIRRSRSESSSNRMSWTNDPLPDRHHGAIECQESVPTQSFSQNETGFRTPVLPRAPRKDLHEHDISSDSALGSTASSGGHSTQGSYSSVEDETSHSKTGK
uniref:cyclin-dependent kinase n=1 Tax=Phallusia mammillata TaxID=59560 RepID=A0A6F9D8C6_9ASCI|nr:cyclin-dependent kinase D-3 [Phallusia mammillata]